MRRKGRGEVSSARPSTSSAGTGRRTDALVRSCAKDEPVLRVGAVGVDASRHPPLGLELVGLGVDGRVVERL